MHSALRLLTVQKKQQQQHIILYPSLWYKKKDTAEMMLGYKREKPVHVSLKLTIQFS